ncbi:MAG TPA: tetratricopeptide repeat protein [Rhizomicrobium sp.]|nr:tetratricopeptide repeat protein [Rhizomicrobium sp.]
MAGASHDVFISYSSRDKTIADGICAVLERHGIRCWIAPRDVLPGADWGQSIVRGIASCRILVLVFSNFANSSSQVRREVERAAHRELPIIPFRVEDVQPNESLEFFISTPHWLDAFTPPLERHVERLAATIKTLLGSNWPRDTSPSLDERASPVPRPPPTTLPPSPPPPGSPDAATPDLHTPPPPATDAIHDEAKTDAAAAIEADVVDKTAAMEPPAVAHYTADDAIPESIPEDEAEAEVPAPPAEHDAAAATPEDEPDAEVRVPAADHSVPSETEATALMFQARETDALPPQADAARAFQPVDFASSSWRKAWLLWAAVPVVVVIAAAVFLTTRSPPPPPRTHTVASNPLWSSCRINGSPDAVVRACTTLIQAGKLSPEEMAKALTARGIAYFYKHDLDAALQDENAAIRVQPTHVRAYVDRGYLYLSKGEYDRAIADYNVAIHLSPMAGAYNDRGLAYASKKDYPAAIADFTSAIRRDPKLMAAYVNRGLVRTDMGKCEEAIPDFDQAIKIGPAGANAYLVRGNCLQQLGKYEPAVRDYDAAVRMLPKLSTAYVGRAMAYAAENKRDLAINDFGTAIQLDAKDFRAYLGRGNVYYAQAKYDQAIADYSSAIQLNPEYPMTYCNRGNAYYAKRKYVPAIADYNAAIRLKPDYASAYRNRAMAERASGKTTAARTDENKARQLGQKQ